MKALSTRTGVRYSRAFLKKRTACMRKNEGEKKVVMERKSE
jgi:hypothetical protein